jgi:hypothetical protein
MPDETSTSPIAPSATPIASDAKLCPVCGEEIKISARKCIHCSSDLTWRSYLTFSNTTLALLTALVSVIATGAPLIRQALEIKNSSMEFFVISGGGMSGGSAYMRVLINNLGARAGTLLGGEIVVSDTKLSVLPEIHMSLSIPHANFYLAKPGETKVIDFDVSWCCRDAGFTDTGISEFSRFITIPRGKSVSEAPINSATCKLNLNVLNFAGGYSFPERPFPCGWLAAMLSWDERLFPEKKNKQPPIIAE